MQLGSVQNINEQVCAQIAPQVEVEYVLNRVVDVVIEYIILMHDVTLKTYNIFDTSVGQHRQHWTNL